MNNEQKIQAAESKECTVKSERPIFMPRYEVERDGETLFLKVDLPGVEREGVGMGVGVGEAVRVT